MAVNVSTVLLMKVTLSIYQKKEANISNLQILVFLTQWMGMITGLEESQHVLCADFSRNTAIVEKIMQLVSKLDEYGIELREKHNLARLKQ